jgi:Zn-dependent M28 family amino/carboxypeptidase
MKSLFTLLGILTFVFVFSQNIEEGEAKNIKEFYNIALSEQQAYKWLDHLCNEIGPRPAGSDNADKAAKWAKSELEKIGLENVWLQEVDVPHWVRGEETATLTELIQEHDLAITALGGSVGTPGEGINASVVEVKSFDELEELGEKNIKGKIVFFNIPMDPTNFSTGFSYGMAGKQRWAGAAEASKFGAVAVLTRSLTLKRDNYPHTGSMNYGDALVKIPAAALSIEATELLHEKLQTNTGLTVKLVLTCKSMERTKGYNVIGEIKGSEKPDEIVLVGGHLDSWDLGTGAQDDGAGSVQSMQVMSLFKKTGYAPKRTHRVVLFMNEEFGLDGAKVYAEYTKENKINHVIALESDGGSGTPRGFSFDTNMETVEAVREFKPLLSPYGLHDYAKGGSGADIGQLKSEGTILIGYRPDNQRYFDYHHAATDQFDIINARELELGAAGMAALLYLMDKYDVEVIQK